MIEARPGQPVRFCSPAPVPASGAGPAPGQAPEPCDGLPVTGVDLGKLSEPWMTGGIQQGRTRLRGTWRSGTFTVTQQLPYVPPPRPGFVDRPVPCEAPPGGWQLKETGRDDLHTYVYNTHPDQFKEPRQVSPLLSDRANGVYFVSLDGATIDVGMKMLTPQLYEKLKGIPNLQPQPWFAPVH